MISFPQVISVLESLGPTLASAISTAQSTANPKITGTTLTRSPSSQITGENTADAVNPSATPTVHQGSPTSHHRILVSIMIPVLVATLSLVAIIVTVIIMIRRRRRKGNRVDGASQVMPYNLRARKDYVPAAEASLKQEFKEAREVAPTMPDHGKGQAERIPIGLVGETGIRDQMVVSGRDGEQLEQNAASGSFTPSATMAIRLDELERQMRSLRTADVAQNQIGGTNLASAEMVATIQRLLVEMNRPPPEYSSALHER